MKAGLAAADARRELVRAARAWHGAGAIDDAERAAIEAHAADDRRGARGGFRALFFALTLLVGLASLAFVATLLGVWRSGARVADVLLFGAFAVAAVFAAEQALGAWRLRGYGVEEGLVWLAILFQAGALWLALDAATLPLRVEATLLGADLALAGVAAAWRWGTPGTGVAAAVGLFMVLGRSPWPRATWIAAAVVVALVCRKLAASESAPVAYRRRAAEGFVVAIGALYLAVHVAAPIGGFFYKMAGRPAGWTGALGDGATAVAWLGMCALPLALLLLGVRGRTRLELALGALLALATGASAIDALDLGPPWALLLGAGALLGGVALALRAAFAARPQRELAGFTDDALYEATGRRSWIELVAALEAFTPAARSLPEAEERGFQGEGGEFGGGGASGRF